MGRKRNNETSYVSVIVLAGDLVTRKGISGFVLFVLGVLISWREKRDRSMNLLSSEAELVPLSEAIKEVAENHESVS